MPRFGSPFWYYVNQLGMSDYQVCSHVPFFSKIGAWKQLTNLYALLVYITNNPRTPTGHRNSAAESYAPARISKLNSFLRKKTSLTLFYKKYSSTVLLIVSMQSGCSFVSYVVMRLTVGIIPCEVYRCNLEQALWQYAGLSMSPKCSQ